MGVLTIYETINLLASSNHKGDIKMWIIKPSLTEFDTSILSKNIQKAHEKSIQKIIFSTQNSSLISCSSDNTMKLWDCKFMNCMQTFIGHSMTVWSAAFHPLGNLLASCSSDNTIKLWDLRTNKRIKTIKAHTNWVWDIVFNPAGNLLASCSSDNKVKLWDLKNHKYRDSIVHKACALNVKFDSLGKRLISSGNDCSIKILNINNEKE